MSSSRSTQQSRKWARLSPSGAGGDLGGGSVSPPAVWPSLFGVRQGQVNEQGTHGVKRDFLGQHPDSGEPNVSRHWREFKDYMNQIHFPICIHFSEAKVSHLLLLR